MAITPEQLKAWTVAAQSYQPPQLSVQPPRLSVRAERTGPAADRRADSKRESWTTPTSLLEARLKVAGLRSAIERVDGKLAGGTRPDAFSNAGEYDAWRLRAEAARDFYASDLALAEECVRHFEQQHERDTSAHADALRERDEARDACRRMAAEIDRLTAVVSGLKAEARSAPLERAFMETARVVLSEVTFQRILERARDASGQRR